MHKLIKLIAPFFAVLLAASPAFATGETCIGYNPLIPTQCLGWSPGLLSGGAWVSGSYSPDSGHVVICDAPNYGGLCQSIPQGLYVADLSQVGWNTTTSSPTQRLSIQSVKVGAGRSIVLWNPAPGGTCGQNGMVCHTVSSNATNTSSWNIDALYVQ